jgi:hypothetical protein
MRETAVIEMKGGGKVSACTTLKNIYCMYSYLKRKVLVDGTLSVLIKKS